MNKLLSAEIPGMATDPEKKADGFVPCWQNPGGKPFAGAYPEIPAICNIDGDSRVLLTLPRTVYAVTGVETRIYFHNLVLADDKNSLRFTVKSSVGECTAEYWTFTPDIPGHYPLKVTVYTSDCEIAGVAETVIRVAPANAGNKCNMVMLNVGDSMLADGVIVKNIRTLLRAHGNDFTRMMGSHSGLGASLTAEDIAVEAYGGWKWQCFIDRHNGGGNYNSESKFTRIVDGRIEFVLQEYLDKYNQGNAPDVVVFALGCNDIALANDNDLQEHITASFHARKKLISEFQRVMPETLIGITLLIPPNFSDAAFEKNYSGKIIRPQYVKNQFNYMRQTLLELQHDPNVSLIPVYTAIDEKRAYPADNAVHPDDYGKQQFAETVFAWLKNTMFNIDRF